MAIVELSHGFAVSPARLWAIAVDFAALARASKGLVVFKTLPEGRVESGAVYDFQVSLFGLLPWQPYRIEILECDDAARRFVTNETGVGVAYWRHTCRVDPDGAGARLTDRIEIDAGWKTPLVAVWARWLYARRHPVRQTMFDEGWGRALS